MITPLCKLLYFLRTVPGVRNSSQCDGKELSTCVSAEVEGEATSGLHVNDDISEGLDLVWAESHVGETD